MADVIALPAAIRDFLRELARDRYPGVPLFTAVASQAAPDAGIRQGDLVVYARADGSAVDGRQALAVGWEGKIIFGRAVRVGDRVQLGENSYPWHTIRGVILAVYRPAPEK